MDRGARENSVISGFVASARGTAAPSPSGSGAVGETGNGASGGGDGSGGSGIGGGGGDGSGESYAVHRLHVSGHRARTNEPNMRLRHSLEISLHVAQSWQVAGQSACTCACQEHHDWTSPHGGIVATSSHCASTIVLPLMRKAVVRSGVSMHVAFSGERIS